MSSPTITFSGYHLSRGYEVQLSPGVHLVLVDSPADLEMMVLLFTGVFYLFNGDDDRLVYDCPGGIVHYHDDDLDWIVDVVDRLVPDAGPCLQGQDDLYLAGKRVGPLLKSGYRLSTCIYYMPARRFPIRDAIMDAPGAPISHHFGSFIKKYISEDTFLSPRYDVAVPLSQEIIEWFLNLCDRVIGVGKVRHEVVFSNGLSSSFTLRCMDGGGTYRRLSNIPGETRYVVNFLYNVMMMRPQDCLIVSTSGTSMSPETLATLTEVLRSDLPHKTFVFLGCR